MKNLSAPMIRQSLIAPCGMNCGICMAFLREKNHCRGCRASDRDKAISVLRCKIKNCKVIKKGKADFCFECVDYPCKRLRQLDKRYRTRYNMSMLENLAYIKENGIRRFAGKEATRWRCPECGGTICVHKGICLSCGNANRTAARNVSTR